MFDELGLGEKLLEDEEVGLCVEFFDFFWEGVWVGRGVLIWASKGGSSEGEREALKRVTALLIISSNLLVLLIKCSL